MYAIYQSGYSICGVGNSLDAAQADAAAWMDPDVDGADWQARLCVRRAGDGTRGETHGQLYARPCTARLVTRVQEYGGDVGWVMNAEGLLDLDEEIYARPEP